MKGPVPGLFAQGRRIRWSVVGVGIAGRARVRALAARRDAELVAVHRGRFAAEAGVPEVDADQVIARAEAVIVSAPDRVHASWVARVLRAGRHCVVEYPLAGSAEEAGRLLALADEVGRVLHVEHIELLSPTTRFMAAAAGAFTSMSLDFTSRAPALPDGAAHARTCLARVHRAIAVGGRVTRVTTHRVDGERLEATLVFERGGHATLRARRGAGRRHLHWVVRGAHTWEIRGREAFVDGVHQRLAGSSLFAQDLDLAMARLRGEPSNSIAPDLLLHALAVVDALGHSGTLPVDPCLS